jgi:hypothetical protein
MLERICERGQNLLHLRVMQARSTRGRDRKRIERNFKMDENGLGRGRLGDDTTDKPIEEDSLCRE